MKKQTHRLLTFALLATTATGAMYCINRFISASSILKDKLNPDKGSFYKWRFGDVFYTKKGSGDPLVLIHDYSQYASSYEWSRMIDVLANDYTVYAIDLLGCGRSDKPKITYTNFLYVQLITDFIKDVIGEKAHLISSGFSTSLSIMSCTYDPSLFGKLILINPTELGILMRNPTKQSRIAKWILELPILGTLIYHIITAKGNIDLLLTENYLYNPFQTDSDMVDTYYESAHRGNGNGKYVLSSIAGNYMNMNILHGLKSLNNSILIIGGKQQPNIINTIESYETYNPAIESIILPRSKFLPHLETPEQVLEQTKIFFEEE